MHRNKQIAIILPDTLQSIGLQSMLTDYFPPVEISHYPTFEALSTSGNDTFDYYFTNAASFVLYADFFLPRRSKTMVLIDGAEDEGGLSATNHITIKASLDGGLTWPTEHQVLLDEAEGWGYSCLSMIDKETVGIFYESSVAHMTFQAVKLQDLIHQ